SPTVAGMESKLAQGADSVRGILRITRHPFLWGTALWSLVHAAFNGDVASLILFGSLLVLAVAGTFSIDAKRRRMFGDRWDGFARTTSNVPFAAIAAGRNQFGAAAREIGLVRPIIAIVVFFVAVALHGSLVGSPLI